MHRRVAAVWVSLIIIISSIVILVEIAERVEAPTTLYVGGAGPGNYSKIQDAINASSDGDTVFVYSGIYYENVIVDKTINLIGEDRLTTIIDGGGGGLVMSIDVNWINISNLFIRNGENGVQFNSDYCMGMNINSSFNTRTGIRFTNSNNNNIYNSSAYSNGLLGIYVWGSDGNTLINNNVVANGDQGIAVADFSDNNKLINNTVVSNSKAGIWLRSTGKNNTVLNNIVCENKWHGIYVTSNYNTVEGNVIDSNDFFGIQIFESINNTIINNTIESPNNHGVRIVSSQWRTSKFNILKNNTISTTNSNYGIWLDEADNNYVTQNNVSGSSNAIFLDLANNNSLTENLLENNGYGISFSDSMNNTISNNIITNNNLGISLISSTDNRIYHNNFIGNTNQAGDDQDLNNWDNGYPSGGNYWSDYLGVDSYNGPNQDLLGSDGIGDSNYSIDSDSVDHYPLMEPYGYKSLENITILKEGWNLISIPLIQTETNIEIVLDSISDSYDTVQWYNIGDFFDQWKHNQTSKPEHMNDLKRISHKISFWIHITKPGETVFTYNGFQPTSNQSIQFQPGWNMVGYPSLTSRNRTEGLNNLEFGVDVDVIQWFDAANKAWYSMGPNDSFVPGRGYWMYSNIDSGWEVPL
jgi:parallel beta-helix repeat protein